MNLLSSDGGLTESAIAEGASAPWPFDIKTKRALHNIAASLKQFLRELPEALLSSEHHDTFINAASTCDVSLHTQSQD